MASGACAAQDSDASESDSDGSESLADSAFIYKAQAAQLKYGGSMSGPDFDRMSQRYEKDLGLGNDMESLLSMDPGGARSQVQHAPATRPGAQYLAHWSGLHKHHQHRALVRSVVDPAPLVARMKAVVGLAECILQGKGSE